MGTIRSFYFWKLFKAKIISVSITLAHSYLLAGTNLNRLIQPNSVQKIIGTTYILVQVLIISKNGISRLYTLMYTSQQSQHYSTHYTRYVRHKTRPSGRDFYFLFFIFISPLTLGQQSRLPVTFSCEYVILTYSYEYVILGICADYYGTFTIKWNLFG